MPPVPRPEVSEVTTREIKDGDEIVITGMAGRFPKSKNIKEFKENLFGKVDMLSETSERWDLEHPELPPKLGLVDDTNVFDYLYFKINSMQAEGMDPLSRIMLECSCEALIDAGINPNEIKDSNTGVFVGGSISESEMYFNLGSKYIDSTALPGCARAMFSNRISYYLGILGPSYTVDGADTTGSSMLEHAYNAMRRGECDAALVGCPNLCMHPYRNINLSRMGLLSRDGRTRCFCDDADGCGRAESIVMVFLQKAKHAKRIYAELVYAKSSFTSLVLDNKDDFRYATEEQMSSFLREFYNEINIDPEVVKYVEAFGSGIKDVDKNEIECFDRIFCNRQRNEPLMIGSVKSNIGHAEMASDMCSLIKVLLIYHSNKIAPNFAMDKPRTDIEAISQGRMRFINDTIPFGNGYTAINCLSINGIQGHILLKDYQTPQISEDNSTELAELVCVSGRVEEAVEEAFLDLESKPINHQQIALLRSMNDTAMPGFSCRGYSLLTTKGDKTVCLQKFQEFNNGENRPVWFVYSGMGAQWPAMAKHLMKIPVFAETIQKLHKILERYEIDLINIITSDDPSIFKDILNCFVGNASVQIALTDLLTSVGIEPEHVIGHSGGEIACAYADGCLTAEQAIIVSYCRGLVSLNTPFELGLMAAVGMGYNAIKNMLPPRIFVACHNGPDSCTISGALDAVKDYVEVLKSQGIFAKEVASNNIAYHSELIYVGAEVHTKYMRDIIKVPKLRSPKWIPTAIPPEKWDDPVLKYCSPEYITTNFTAPVLFEEVCNLVPANAIAIEIGPHALMQAILKRSLSPDCLNVPLTRRGHEDNSILVLSALGKLFTAGLQPKIQNLYPPVKFPVPADTPLLSHTTKWSHTENLKCLKFIPGDDKISTERRVTLTAKDERYKYLTGYQVGGVSYVSPSDLLVLVWETLGMVLGVPYKEMSIEFRNIRIDSDVELNDDLVTLSVILQRASGNFEIAKDGIMVASGIIEAKKNKMNKATNKMSDDHEKVLLTSGEIYRIFGLRGYNYRGVYRSLYNMNTNFTKAEIQWKENWAAFIDGVIQIGLLCDSKQLVRPKYIQSLVVDVREQELASLAGQFEANYDEILNAIRCAGVELRHMELVNVTKPKHSILPKIAEQLTFKKGDDIQNAQLNIAEPGDLDSFAWIQNPSIPNSKPDKILVQVHYARIGYADLMRAQNRQVPGEPETDKKTFGISFSGITKSGERVMGLVESGAASNYVHANPDFLWKVPDHWTLEEAATVPQAYAQTLYCLFGRSSSVSLTPDMTVLVTSGSGALGQAVINVCLAHGCEVFTTVSDAKKKKILLKLFPTLKESNVCNSMEQNVSDVVLSGTSGKGCNIIISSAHGSERTSAVCCSTEMASFFDIGIEDLVESGQFGMAFLSSERNYIVTIFASIFNEANVEMRKYFQKIIYKGIGEGWVRPISHVVFDSSETCKAFKTISSRRNLGAILLRLQNEQQSTTSTHIVPTWQCTDGTYVVICGRKNIGIEIADKLVKLGAKKIVIGCTDSNSGYLKLKLKSWQEKGVQIGLSPANFTNPTAYIDFMTTASNLGVIKGLFIVNNANILKHMDEVTKTLFPVLRHFVAVEYKDDNIGVSEIETICANRSKAGLSSTTITCPIAKNQNQNEDVVYEEMANALNEKVMDLELLLLDKQNSIQNGTDDKSTDIKVDDLIELLGVDPENLDSNLNLEELKVNLTSAKTLSLVLHVKSGIYCAPHRLLKMTIADITDMMLSKEQETKKSGYSLLFSKFNRDEIDASEPYVWAETQRCENFKITEYSEGEDYLILLPGIEGNADALLEICRQLKIRALVCQFSANKTAKTIKDLAEELTELIIRRVGIKSRFYILGYEYGSIVALEMAAIFEGNGLQGKVFCLNGSPMATKQLIQTHTNRTNEHEAQNQYLLNMCSLIDNNESVDDLALSLATEENWSIKLDCCLRYLRSKTNSTTEYQRIVIESGWRRIYQTLSYNSKIKLNSPIVLIKEASTRSIPEDYGLQQYSSEAVSVYNLETSHEEVLKDFAATDIINRELDDDVLKTFEDANLCVKYTVLEP